MAKLFDQAIPPVPRDSDRQTTQFLAALRNALTELQTKYVVSRSGGLARAGSDASSDINNYLTSPSGGGESGEQELDYSTPATITGLTASGGIVNVVLSWAYSGSTDIGYFEIHRADTNNVANAALVGSTAAQVYADTVDPGSSHYYWVRGVSTGSTVGAFQPTAVQGTAAQDPFTVLADATQGIAESNLTQALLDDLPELSGTDDLTADLENNAHIIKLDNNGRVAGFGLYNSGTTSDFIIRADRFAVVNQNTNGGVVTPFVIQNGNVIMDNAFIVDLTASNIASRTITANQIATGAITATEIDAGTITANELDTNSVTSDKIQAGAVTAGKLVLDNATITGDGNAIKIKNLGVDTLQIADRAVTLPEFTYNSNTVATYTPSNNYYFFIGTLNIPNVAANDKVFISFSFHFYTNQNEYAVAGAGVTDGGTDYPIWEVGSLSGGSALGIQGNTTISGSFEHTANNSGTLQAKVYLAHGNAGQYIQGSDIAISSVVLRK